MSRTRPPSQPGPDARAPLVLRVVPGRFAIHRFPPGTPLPPALASAAPCWVARTAGELSVACPESLGLEAPRSSTGWACLAVRGPLDFGLTGVLAGLTGVLAGRHVPVFALSTFDTDYLLLPTARLRAAVVALREAGYEVEEDRSSRGAGAGGKPAG